MNLFSSSSKYSLGIDIGTTSIKAVELTRDKDRYKLMSYASLSLRPSIKSSRDLMQISADFVQMSEGQVADIIKYLIDAGSFNKGASNNVYMSLPAFSSFITIIEVPVMSDRELRDAIPFEAKQYIPVPVSEVSIDWNILTKPTTVKKGMKSDSASALSGSNEIAPNRMEVLLVAVPKETVNRYLKIAQLAGLRLKSLEIESFSNVRSIIGNDQSSGIIVDIGGHDTNMIVAYNGIIYANYNSNIGGNDFTRVIGQSLNLNEQRAETIKKSVGLSNEQGMNILDLLLPLADKIISDIDKASSVYRNRRPNAVLDKIILAGQGAELRGLVEYLKAKTRMEVVLASPFSRIFYAPALESNVNELNAIFSVACGLAMGGV